MSGVKCANANAKKKYFKTEAKKQQQAWCSQGDGQFACKISLMSQQTSKKEGKAGLQFLQGWLAKKPPLIKKEDHIGVFLLYIFHRRV